MNDMIKLHVFSYENKWPMYGFAEVSALILNFIEIHHQQYWF